MASHRSRRPTSSDSGYDSTASSPPNNRTKDFGTSDTVDRIAVKKIRAQNATLQNASLLSEATRTDLNASIGTQLSGVQLSTLDQQQLDELALLVAERGVVIFREQDLGFEEQARISGQFGKHGKHIIEKEPGKTKIKKNANDFGEVLAPVTGRKSEWVSDWSFETTPPSFSILSATDAHGETAWVSQYGIYDSLSRPVKRFVDELQAIHTSQIQYTSIRDLRGMPTERSPVVTQHPAVRTHPVTGLKALNVTPGAVTGFNELSKKESDKLLELLEYQINSSDEHTIRFRWEAGSVAIWDNRSTAYKHISSTGFIKGFETSTVGEKPYFDPKSESRAERSQRLAQEAEDERIRLEDIKKRFNNTPLRRILRRQASGAPLASPVTPPAQQSQPVSQTAPEVKSQPLFRLRSNSEIREQEQHIWAQTSSTTAKESETKPLFRLRSNSEIRALEQEVWAKSASTSEQTAPQESSEKRQTVVRVNSNGSPLRRIIQRQTSGTQGARRRDWK
ncbi:hypothetical protein BKA63DRAFT_573365 [Paraphoma chrysanthemicola]|nr:hypothetical protein BKA63DRAFT_573365 [Paraphoma chrysanthemicola]